MSTAGKLGPSRPSRAAQDPIGNHVAKATKAVTSDGEEKQLKAIVPTRYHKGTGDIKNMSTEGVPVKYLIMEALDDLFSKYARGEGRYNVDDQAELARRLESLK